ncbi:hypothetical protein M3J09_006313 [Ascochyta lentis]
MFRIIPLSKSPKAAAVSLVVSHRLWTRSRSCPPYSHIHLAI